MLFWAREEFGTYRVDIDVLFGRELIGRGHEIDFVMQAATPDVEPGAHAWCGRTVYVGRAAGQGTVARFLRHLYVFWHDLRCLRLARADRYDAIQFRDKFLIAAIGILVARLRGLKYFYWLSFPYPEDDFLRARTGATRYPLLVRMRGHLAAWLLYRWILPRATHSFVQSAQMKQDIVARGVAPECMTPVPMGIDLNDIPRETRTQDARPDGAFVVGYLGTLTADRHLEVLIDMLAELRNGGAAARLLLIGDAIERADREALIERAQALGVADHLEITGMLPRVQALQMIRQVHVAMSPYFPNPLLLSTSPTKLVEYLALGIPVVASEHPEQRAILRVTRAGVCAPWGSRHFARSVRWLMGRSGEELKSMGERGQSWVREHRTYKRIADDLEQQYTELLFSSPDRRNRGMIVDG
jgi:glycosyltransferase involved in cell wall biosynthesis